MGNSLVRLCISKGLSSSQVPNSKLTLQMLLPYLQELNKKWRDVREEHLVVHESNCVAELNKYMSTMIYDKEALRALFGDDDSEERSMILEDD